MLEVEWRSPSVSSVSSGLACCAAYQRAVENQLQDKDKDKGDKGDDNNNDTPLFELEAHANALKVKWCGSPSVLSGLLGLARVSDCL